MTALGKVAGSMLKDNLVRNGVDLILDSNLMYWDVVNRRVGINTTMPGNTFVANGNSTLSNIYINGGNITSLTGNLVLNSLTGNINVSNKQIKNLREPSDNSDAATKYYVDLVNTFAHDLHLVIQDDFNSNTNVYVASETVNFKGTANQVNVVVTSNDTVTYSLTNNVTINGNLVSSNANITNTLIASNITVGNITVSNSLTSNGNVSFLTANIGNLYLHDNIISAKNTDGNISLTPNGNGVIISDSTTAFKLPTGNNINRPEYPTQGMIRYNHTLATVEVYDGAEWKSLMPPPTVIVSDKFVGDGSKLSFDLSQPSTTGGAIVTINGVLQIPDSSYYISGSSLIFLEAPISSDIIEARLLTTTTTVTDLLIGDSSIFFDTTSANYPINMNVNNQRKIKIDTANTTVYNNLVTTNGIFWPNGNVYNTGIMVVSVPNNSKGASGDVTGMMAFSSTNIYYCTGNYNGTTNIWVKSAWTTTGTW